MTPSGSKPIKKPSGGTDDYRTFDQHEKLGDPPWSGPALEGWEEAHGHDVRLSCYPEFGCKVLESLTEDVLEAARAVDDAPTDGDKLRVLHYALLALDGPRP